MIDKLSKEIIQNQEELALIAYEGLDRVISSHEKLSELKVDAEHREILKIKSMIPKLDSLIDGFREGTVNIVSGPTGEGKTSFTQSLTQYFSEQNVPCVWFSFEVSPMEFFEKFGESVPLFYLPKEIPENENTIKWLRQRVVEAKAKYDIKVVFIDHLHYLQDMQGLSIQNNASNYIGDLLRKLKRMSIELNLVIFLIAHTKTDAGNTAELKKYYTKDDIRDSSFVKQEADIVMMIWRKRAKVQNEVGWEYTQNAVLNVDKHRRTGKVGFISLVHQNGKFTEYTNNY